MESGWKKRFSWCNPSYTLCLIALTFHLRDTSIMRIVPPDEYAGAVAYLEKRGHRVRAIDSLTSADPAPSSTRVDGKELSAEEVVSLAIQKGWVLP